MRTILTCSLFITSLLQLPAQCLDTLSFSPSTETGVINWEQFPEFELPFILVYQGPRGNDTTFAPLRHGFSHLAKFNEYDYQHLLPEYRAIIFPRIASPNEDQPWEMDEIPWNNDMNIYENHWNFLVNHFFGDFYDFAPDSIPNADILVADIEAAKFLSEITGIKNHPDVPNNIQQLSDFEFILEYRSEMVKRYSEALHFLKEATAVSMPLLSSYSDTPILRYADEIGVNSWDFWSNTPYPLNYLLMDTLSPFSFGSVYNVQDFLTPSAYYFYDFPDERASDYLAYLLFQYEVNRARSDKDQVPFVWLSYHNCCTDSLKNIQPFMAEATAIFPLMSGAKGLWVWDHRKNETLTDTALLYNYEYFTRGLHRLSLFKDYFTGCHGFVAADIAYNHFVNNTPIWRGVVQGNKILIAANNPYAEIDATTIIPVQYKNWSTEISVGGKDTYLCDHIWAPENQSVSMYPGQLLFPSDTSAQSYLWSTGETTPTIAPATEGMYSVTVTDIYGCEYLQNFEVLMLTGSDNPEDDPRFIGIADNILSSGTDITLLSSGDPGVCHIRISDPLGHEVRVSKENLSQERVQLATDPLPTGMYYLTVSGEDWSETVPFVIY